MNHNYQSGVSLRNALYGTPHLVLVLPSSGPMDSLKDLLQAPTVTVCYEEKSASFRVLSFPDCSELTDPTLSITLDYPLLHQGQFYPGQELLFMDGDRLLSMALITAVPGDGLLRRSWPAEPGMTFLPQDEVESFCLNLEFDLLTTPFICDYAIRMDRNSHALRIEVVISGATITQYDALRLVRILQAGSYPLTYCRTDYRQLANGQLAGLTIRFLLEPGGVPVSGALVVL